MGYTHYLYQPKQLDKKKFNLAAIDCKKVTEWLDAPIQFECDDPSPPAFNNDMIRFNGIEDEGHETFLVAQTYVGYGSGNPSDNGKYFSFCKTARKEYDTAVTACFVVLKHYFGDDIIVRSDGYPEEWAEGVGACQKCLGYGEVPFKKEKIRGY